MPYTEVGGKPLDTYVQVLTPVLPNSWLPTSTLLLGKLLHRNTQRHPARPLPLETYLYVLSAAHYQAVREVLAYGTFAQVEGARGHGAADKGPRPRPRPAPACGY